MINFYFFIYIYIINVYNEYMNNYSYNGGYMELHSKDLLNGLSEFFKIFGDTTRLRILDVLLNGNMCVKDISETLNISQSAISHQLKNLRSSNLVKTEKIGQTVNYSIADEHIKIIYEYGIEHIKEVFK